MTHEIEQWAVERAIEILSKDGRIYTDTIVNDLARALLTQAREVEKNQYDRNAMRCPSCGSHALFVDSAHGLTCGVIGCKEPCLTYDAYDRIKELQAQVDALKKENAGLKAVPAGHPLWAERCRKAEYEADALKADKEAALAEILGLQEDRTDQEVEIARLRAGLEKMGKLIDQIIECDQNSWTMTGLINQLNSDFKEILSTSSPSALSVVREMMRAIQILTDKHPEAEWDWLREALTKAKEMFGG